MKGIDELSKTNSHALSSSVIERVRISTNQMNKAMSKFSESFGKRNQEALKNFSVAANKWLDKNGYAR